MGYLETGGGLGGGSWISGGGGKLGNTFGRLLKEGGWEMGVLLLGGIDSAVSGICGKLGDTLDRGGTGVPLGGTIFKAGGCGKLGNTLGRGGRTGVPLGGTIFKVAGGCGKGGNTLGCVAKGGRLTCGRRLCSAGVNSTSPTVRCDWFADLDSRGKPGRTAKSTP